MENNFKLSLFSHVKYKKLKDFSSRKELKNEKKQKEYGNWLACVGYTH